MRILGRPADPGGIENYNRLMNSGFSESQMRESLLRSQEYADKNPETVLAATAITAVAGGRSAAKKTKTKKKTRNKTTRAVRRR